MKIIKAFYKNLNIRIGIIFLIATIALSYSSDYMQFKDRACVVVDKMQTAGGYKASGQFILILKDEQNRTFDRYVAASTYSQAIVGNMYKFNLREFDIKQTPTNNTIYFFGYCTFLTVTIVFLFLGIVLWGNEVYNMYYKPKK